MLPLLAQAISNPLPNVSGPSDLVDIFKNPVLGWWNKSETWGQGLFSMLMAVNLAWFGAKIWQRRHELDTLSASIFYKVVALFFFNWLLMSFGLWGQAFLDLFTGWGKDLSGISSLGPSIVFGVFAEVSNSLLGSMAVAGIHLDIPGALGLLFGALAMIAAGAWIAYHLVIALVESYMAIAIGPFILGFGGSDWTTPYVERYFSLMFATGIRLASLYLTIGLGIGVANSWKTTAATLGAANNGIITAWIIACTAFIFGGIVSKAGTWLASHLNGTPSMSTAEVFGIMSAVAMFGVGAASAMLSGGATASATNAAGGPASGGMTAGAGATGGGGATGGSGAVQPSPPHGNGSVPQPSPPMIMKIMSSTVQAMKSLPTGGNHSSGAKIGMGHGE